MDHLRISSIELSSMIHRQTTDALQTFEMTCPNNAKRCWSQLGWCNKTTILQFWCSKIATNQPRSIVERVFRDLLHQAVTLTKMLIHEKKFLLLRWINYFKTVFNQRCGSYGDVHWLSSYGKFTFCNWLDLIGVVITFWISVLKIFRSPQNYWHGVTVVTSFERLLESSLGHALSFYSNLVKHRSKNKVL